MSEKVNAVLGYVHGYRWNDISGFVQSLRRTGYSGEICLICSAVAPDELEKFRAHGVRVEASPYACRKFKNSWAKSWRVLRYFPPLVRRLALPHLAQVTILRFLLYEQHFLREGSRYRRVLLSDVRDVWFQADPFQVDLGAGVHAFSEAAGRTIESEEINLRWIRHAFNTDVQRWLGKEPILCSGTIIASADSLPGFLSHFRQCFYLARRIRSGGIDQGVFNYAVRTCREPHVTIHNNGEATVLTMGIMPESDIRCDAIGRVVRPDGTVIPVLHQFDRHPQIAARLLAGC